MLGANGIAYAVFERRYPKAMLASHADRLCLHKLVFELK